MQPEKMRFTRVSLLFLCPQFDLGLVLAAYVFVFSDIKKCCKTLYSTFRSSFIICQKNVSGCKNYGRYRVTQARKTVSS